jgi:hypothetical protein
MRKGSAGKGQMRIYVQSNFVIPGLGTEESVDFDCSSMTLRQFLEELSKMAPTPIQYVRPGAKTLNPDDWQAEVNRIPYQDCSDGLETQLMNDDTVTIKILAFGGG